MYTCTCSYIYIYTYIPTYTYILCIHTLYIHLPSGARTSSSPRAAGKTADHCGEGEEREISQDVEGDMCALNCPGVSLVCVREREKKRAREREGEREGERERAHASMKMWRALCVT